MSAAPDLSQVAARLYALSSSGDAAPVPFWGGYLPSANAAFGPTATLDDAWRDAGGTYLFLPVAPADPAAFTAALAELLARLSPAGEVRLLWLENPNALPALWRLTPLLARAGGSGPAIAWSVARAAQLALGEYAVDLTAGTAMTQADPQALGWGIAFAGAGFAAPGGVYTAGAGSVWLPLAGATVGCLRAQLTLPADGHDHLAALRTQLCFGAPQDDGTPGDGVELLGMPVIAQAADPLTLHLSFDPLHPLTAARTRLGFFPDDGSGTAPALPATLRSSRGYPTTLTPLAGGAPLRAAQLAFGRTPLVVGDASAFSWHLAPDGTFALAVQPPSGVTVDRHRVLLGRSGLEYAALPAVGGAYACFQAGRPALALGAAPHPQPSEAGAPLLSDAATTAHMTVLAPTSAAAGLLYYAQPVQAPLYAGASASLPAGFLGYVELPSATLPSWASGAGDPPATVPVAPLAGVAPADGPLAERVEAVLAPARRLALGPPPTAADAAVTAPAVTPQGLLVEVGGTAIERVVVATMGTDALQRLELTAAGPKLRGVLGSAELFAVIANPDAYMADSSVRYRLDDAGLAIAQARGVPPGVIALLRPIVTPGGRARTFDDEASFVAAVRATAPTYVELLCELAGDLQARLSDWVVQLSPRAWRRPSAQAGASDAPTIMLLKYARRSLEQLAQDGAAWPWPEAAALPHGGVEATQAELRRIFDAARARAEDPSVPDDDPYAAFYRDVVADPGWNGVLFLNAPVAAGRLPAALQFVTAGVDPDRFYAHHVGFSATPVALDGGAIATRQTAAFGLIDYDDPHDLTLSAHEREPVPFAFKTLRLTARFANAALAGFAARGELLVNELFAARLAKLDPTHGNNLVLSGSLQTARGGAPTYAFALEGRNRYGTTATMLDTLDVTSVQVQSRDGAAGAGAATTRFLLAGQLRFAEPPRFDAFGYGPQAQLGERDGWLSFDGLAVDMTFPLGVAGRQMFATDLTGVRLDAGTSRARPNALVTRFPLTLTGLVSAPAGQRPEDLGYVSIAAQMEQTPLRGPWFGLAYTLDLGTLGTLADDAPLRLGLLAAWGPAQEDGERPAYLGLLLPGYRDGSFGWPLQGVLRLGFRSFEFETAEDPAGVRSYALRLRRLALSVLGLSFPPGTADLVLFGDGGDPQRRVVGWYGAYAAKPREELTR